MEKPLHVQVAEALGWQDTYPADSEDGWLGFAPKPWAKHPPWHIWMTVPRFDTDWSATGPLIERLDIAMWPQSDGWAAEVKLETRAIGATPLIAVCNLILALHASGKLPAVAASAAL